MQKKRVFISSVQSEFAVVIRTLKHTVNKVPSLRDLGAWCRLLVRRINPTVNKVLSRRDRSQFTLQGYTLLTVCFSVRVWGK
jgi:hypothetical protein